MPSSLVNADPTKHFFSAAASNYEIMAHGTSFHNSVVVFARRERMKSTIRYLA